MGFPGNLTEPHPAAIRSNVNPTEDGAVRSGGLRHIADTLSIAVDALPCCAAVGGAQAAFAIFAFPPPPDVNGWIFGAGGLPSEGDRGGPDKPEKLLPGETAVAASLQSFVVGEPEGPACPRK